jgi:hypothetical protein
VGSDLAETLLCWELLERILGFGEGDALLTSRHSGKKDTDGYGLSFTFRAVKLLRSI